jgi:uncharacterized protein
MNRMYGSTVLVTGGAGGIGAEFARQCGEMGYNLFLVDKKKDDLEQTAAWLSEHFHDSSIEYLIGDLVEEEFRWEIIAKAIELDTGMVINNAGISRVGRFIDLDEDFLTSQGQTNVIAPLHITKGLVPSMVARGAGGIIMLASGSANTGTALAANYAGTKAWNLIFGESLWYELKPLGIDVLSVIVGATESPGWYSNSPDAKGPIKPMAVSRTVKSALSALGKKPSISPGISNKLGTWFMRNFPRKMTIKAVSRTMERMFENK